MENSNWKLGAKIVAYFDLVTSIISLLLLGGGAVLLLIKFADEELNSTKSSVAGSSLRLIFAIAFTYVGIVLWASIKLLQAVKEEADKNVALRKAKIWRNVHIVFLILGTIGAVANLQITSAVGVVVRGILMFVVWKFIASLKHEISVSLPTTVDYTASTVKEKDASYGQFLI